MGMSITQPAVELRDAWKTFGTIQAVKGINITVQPGEAVAFLGPNGAGKTTAISLMLGLRKLTSGQATLWGKDPRLPASRSRVGVMLQESGVPQTLKVREVVEMFRRLYPQPLEVAAALTIAQLETKANASVASLSGGQRQRLYFALALVGDPELLVLDEPTVALDVETRRVFWETLTRMIDRGKTVILTTHYLEEADALAKRIVVINHGQIVADASPQAIKSRIGGKYVRFRGPTVHETDIQALPNIQRATRTADKWELLTLEPERVLAQLFANGVALNELEVVGAGLEEAFISITQEGAAA